jgi:hypothetical protein
VSSSFTERANYSSVGVCKEVVREGLAGHVGVFSRTPGLNVTTIDSVSKCGTIERLT